MFTRFRFAALAGLLVTIAACSDRSTSKDSGTTRSGQDGGVRRIVFINNQNSPFWDACRAGMLEAQRELKLESAGLTTVMEVNDGSPEGQIDKLRQLGTQQDIAGVAVSPIVADNPSIAQELRKLRSKGLPVICVDNDLGERYRQDDTRQFYIGTDNVKGGRQLGLCAKALRPDGGEFVQFVGRTGAQNARERMDGFQETVGEKFTEKARMADGGPQNARNTVRDALTNYPDLDMLVGIWSYNAPAIVDVVKEKQRPELTVVTFDAEKLAVEAMSGGHIDAMVVQNPFDMGYQMVKLLKALHEKDEATVKEMFPKHGQPSGDIYETGLKVVLPSDDSPVKQVKFDEGTEVLTLDQFKQWLAKYNLESS